MMKKNNEIALRQNILLTFQVALLGMVDKHLRGVTVSWEEDKIEGVFLYDGALGDIEEETASDVEAEIMASFPEYEVSVVARRCDTPADLNASGLKAWVYRRRENYGSSVNPVGRNRVCLPNTHPGYETSTKREKIDSKKKTWKQESY